MEARRQMILAAKKNPDYFKRSGEVRAQYDWELRCMERGTWKPGYIDPDTRLYVSRCRKPAARSVAREIIDGL